MYTQNSHSTADSITKMVYIYIKQSFTLITQTASLVLIEHVEWKYNKAAH